MCGPSPQSGGGGGAGQQGPSIQSQRESIALENENDRMRVETNFYNWLTEDGKLFDEINQTERDLESARMRQREVEGAGGQGEFGVSDLEKSLTDLESQRQENQFVFDFQTNFGSGDIGGDGFSDAERRKNQDLQTRLEGTIQEREAERLARQQEVEAEKQKALDDKKKQSEASFVTGGSATSGEGKAVLPLPENTGGTPGASVGAAIKKKQEEEEQSNLVSPTQAGGSTQSNLVKL